MKKIIQITLLVGFCIFTTVACTQNQMVKQAVEVNEQEGESTQVEAERYQAYIEVLSDIIEKQHWPDGSDVLEDPMFGGMYEDRFAICDVDKDDNEELLVEITTASMAGMRTRVFDYDRNSKQVIEQWTSLPGCTYYENGVVYVEHLHNQTFGVTIRPFSLFQYVSGQDTFEYVGEAYCQDREGSVDAFPDAEDLDGDGVIYYISDSNHEEKSATREEYDAWLNSYLNGADEIYVPYENLFIDNVDLFQHYIETRGAVRGINVVPEKKILEYDITGDGKNDSIYIHCEEPNEYDYGYGYQWSVFINDKMAYEIKDDWGIKPEVRLYQVNEKRNYISIEQHQVNNGDISDYVLYQIEKEQLKRVCDFFCNNISPSHVFHYGAQLQTMTKDKIKLLCSNQFNATAHMQWEMEFEYKDNKWILSSTEYQVVYDSYLDDKKDGMTANQQFIVYMTTACDEEAFSVKKGEVVMIDKVSIKNGKVCFRVTNTEGNEGWLLDPEDSSLKINDEWLYGYFEEALFAG